MKKKIKFNDLHLQWSQINRNAIAKLNVTLIDSDYILGKPVLDFEKNFCQWIGSKYGVGVGNGTDAITIAIDALGCDSDTEIIIPANTFIATILGAQYSIPDARFTLIDCDEYYQIDIELLEKHLKNNRSLSKNCIIMPVHLYGHGANMEEIIRLASYYNCYIIEDAAQAHGTKINGKSAGAFGIMATFSFYPGKNLGALGDGGFITTNKDLYYDVLQKLRNLGSIEKYKHVIKGRNSRLDTIQAIILNEKLNLLDSWNQRRNEIAKLYNGLIENKNIIKPKTADYCTYHNYHLYCVRCKERDVLKKHLDNNLIETGIHYPTPIELSSPFKGIGNNPRTRKYSNELLSLPMHPFLTDSDAEEVCVKINEWQS